MSEWPYASGEMMRCIRAHDWAPTSLGPIETWSPNLRTVVDLTLGSPIATLLLWGSTHIQIYNGHWRELIGDKHPAALGRPTHESFPDIADTMEPIYARALRGEPVILQDTVLPIGRPGEVQQPWWNVHYLPIRDESGAVVGIVCTTIETTGGILAQREREAVVAALRESETRFRAFVTASSDVVDRMSPDWSQMRELSGRGFLADTAEPREGWLEVYIDPDDWPEVQGAIQRAIEAKSLFELEHRVRRADGTLGWTLSRAVPILDSAGAISEWLGAASDITVRKQAEEALRESEGQSRNALEKEAAAARERDRLLAMLSQSQTMVCDWDGRVEIWSHGMERLFGFTSAEAVGRNARALLHTEGNAWPEIVTTLRRDESWQGEVQHRAKDGSPRFVQETWSVEPGLDNTVSSLVVAEEDQTAVKQAEDALRELNAELERRVAERTGELMAAEATLRQVQKMDAVGQLASGIAHDFNNMLQGITGSLDLSRRRSEQGRLADAARHLDSARETVQRAAALTHRLLAFSRQQTLDPTPVRLDQLVSGMIEMIRRTVGSAIQVEVRLGDGVWTAVCDASQLENALLNLCVNARDAMPEGGWLTILTEEAQLSAADLVGEPDLVPGAYVAVSVTDTGVGMSPEVIARVFEPFYTTKPLGKGTGLGLSQVYGFVRQSHGLVRLESAPGQGTTVRLFLPRSMASDEASNDATASDVVLLIEDEESLRATTAEWLRDAGYHVLEASDAASALRLLHGGGRVDILVTDIGLPGDMDGRQLGEAARTQRPKLPVLFVTAYMSSTTRVALPDGMAIIDKPFPLAELTARVRTMLEAAKP